MYRLFTCRLPVMIVLLHALVLACSPKSDHDETVEALFEVNRSLLDTIPYNFYPSYSFLIPKGWSPIDSVSFMSFQEGIDGFVNVRDTSTLMITKNSISMGSNFQESSFSINSVAIKQRLYQQEQIVIFELGIENPANALLPHIEWIVLLKFNLLVLAVRIKSSLLVVKSATTSRGIFPIWVIPVSIPL